MSSFNKILSLWFTTTKSEGEESFVDNNIADTL